MLTNDRVIDSVIVIEIASGWRFENVKTKRDAMHNMLVCSSTSYHVRINEGRSSGITDQSPTRITIR